MYALVEIDLNTQKGCHITAFGYSTKELAIQAFRLKMLDEIYEPHTCPELVDGRGFPLEQCYEEGHWLDQRYGSHYDVLDVSDEKHEENYDYLRYLPRNHGREWNPDAAIENSFSNALGYIVVKVKEYGYMNCPVFQVHRFKNQRDAILAYRSLLYLRANQDFLKYENDTLWRGVKKYVEGKDEKVDTSIQNRLLKSWDFVTDELFDAWTSGMFDNKVDLIAIQSVQDIRDNVAYGLRNILKPSDKLNMTKVRRRYKMAQKENPNSFSFVHSIQKIFGGK